MTKPYEKRVALVIYYYFHLNSSIYTLSPSYSREAGKNEYQDLSLIGINFNDLKLGNTHLGDHIFCTKNWYRFCTTKSQGEHDWPGIDQDAMNWLRTYGRLPSNPLLGVEDRVGKVVSMRI